MLIVATVAHLFYCSSLVICTSPAGAVAKYCDEYVCLCACLSARISLHAQFFWRPFVNRFALCYRTVVCPVCLSVTFVHCGQTVGRIKMKLGMQVGLGSGHIVLDGDPAPPPPKGYSPLPQFSAHICLIAAKCLHGSRCHLVWS